MGEYIRRPGDKAYRRVHLFVTGVPEFISFSHGTERIPYGDEEVLEVLTEDGTTSLHYHTDQRQPIYYNFPDKEVLKITCNGILQICARIWVVNQGSLVRYKLPTTLPLGKDNKLSATVPGITGDTRLDGDAYFNRVFQLKKV